MINFTSNKEIITKDKQKQKKIKPYIKTVNNFEYFSTGLYDLLKTIIKTFISDKFINSIITESSINLVNNSQVQSNIKNNVYKYLAGNKGILLMTDPLYLGKEINEDIYNYYDVYNIQEISYLNEPGLTNMDLLLKQLLKNNPFRLTVVYIGYTHYNKIPNYTNIIQVLSRYKNVIPIFDLSVLKDYVLNDMLSLTSNPLKEGTPKIVLLDDGKTNLGLINISDDRFKILSTRLKSSVNPPIELKVETNKGTLTELVVNTNIFKQILYTHLKQTIDFTTITNWFYVNIKKLPIQFETIIKNLGQFGICIDYLCTKNIIEFNTKYFEYINDPEKRGIISNVISSCLTKDLNKEDIRELNNLLLNNGINNRG